MVGASSKNMCCDICDSNYFMKYPGETPFGDPSSEDVSLRYLICYIYIYIYIHVCGWMDACTFFSVASL